MSLYEASERELSLPGSSSDRESSLPIEEDVVRPEGGEEKGGLLESGSILGESSDGDDSRPLMSCSVSGKESGEAGSAPVDSEVEARFCSSPEAASGSDFCKGGGLSLSVWPSVAPFFSRFFLPRREDLRE